MLVSLLDYKSLESLTSIAPFTTDIPTYHIKDSGQLEWFGWSVWSSGLGDFVVQLVEVSSGRSWCLSGWDCHGCQSCVLLRVGRLVTGQYILDGKVVGKVRLVGAVYLVDWLDGQCGQVGQVVGMLESSGQDDISNRIEWRLYLEV